MLVAAERSGIPCARALDVLADSAVGSPYMAYKRAALLDPDSAEVQFTVRLFKQDLALAMDLGRSTDVPMQAVALAREALTLAAAEGYGDDDVVRMADVLRSRAVARV